MPRADYADYAEFPADGVDAPFIRNLMPSSHFGIIRLSAYVQTAAFRVFKHPPGEGETVVEGLWRRVGVSEPLFGHVAGDAAMLEGRGYSERTVDGSVRLVVSMADRKSRPVARCWLVIVFGQLKVLG
jgi:hypothetical protein